VKVIPKPGANSSEGWLKSNEESVVLAVSSVGSHGSRYLIWSDMQQSPVLFPASDFVIVDSTLSPRWSAVLDANGFICLAPEAWQMSGFWESYYDGDAGAESVFLNEMNLLTRQKT
jgi:hypothetical protein